MGVAGTSLAGFCVWLGLLAAVGTAAAEDAAPTRRLKEARSGTEFQSRETQAMQQDAMANPGMLWVGQGEALWQRKEGAAGKACIDCHGDAAGSMKGVAPRYPAVDPASGKLLNLEGRINACRDRHQKAPPLVYESDGLLALTAWVALQSRGLPMRVSIAGAARPHFEAGRELFMTRQGQLNLACAQCHDDNWGKQLRGDRLSQGQPVGYPAYRLEWQGLASLHRRLRACSQGVRAVVYDYGSPEYLALELYLAWRAEGLPVETPAVRR